MGIPNLISTLEPLAERELVRDRSLVIDGPSLAYHVLYLCRRNGIRQPSNGLVGRTVVSFLDKLVNSSVNVGIVYFDGFLPEEKLPVRMERMVKNTGQLNQFHALHPTNCPERHLYQQEETDIDISTTNQQDPKQLLAPPFLVPAVIDALRQCPRYSDKVSLIPGEADAFCAEYAANFGGIVLTSDSDLLVHDLKGGSVAFFRDICFSDDSEEWEALVFNSQKIVEKLGLPPQHPQRIGYEVYCERHATLSQIAHKCKKPVVDELEFRRFCHQYLYHETSEIPLAHGGQPLATQSLDPRVSEVFLPLGNRETDETPPKMFLPVLVESPLRGSAWEPSTPVRELAYTLLIQLVPGQAKSVEEYRRVQMQQQKGRSIFFGNAISAHQEIDDLISQMQTLRQHESIKQRPDLFWLVLCLALNIQECQNQDKKALALELISAASSGTQPETRDKVPWDIVHFTAQVQASFYSLRMLQQITSLAPDEAWDNLEVGPLKESLKDLPPLTEFPDVPYILNFLRKQCKQLDVLDIIGAEKYKKEDTVEKNGKNTKTKKRKRAQKQGEPAKRPVAQGANMFSLLGDEE